VRQDDWKLIRRVLDQSFNRKNAVEWGIIGAVKVITAQVFAIERVFPPQIGDIDQSRGGLRFVPNYIRRCQLQAKREELNGLAFFHTHPFSDDRVGFSSYDDDEEPKLVENLVGVWEGCVVLGFVVGKSAIQGRAYIRETVSPIENILVPGKTIHVLPGNGRPAPRPRAVSIFDRAQAITGAGALQLLEAMKICVVGAGGTGSLMVELLRRAGCRRITVIDDDRIEDSNLNRVLHSGSLDVQEKRKKVFIAAEANQRSGLDTQLSAIDGNILTPIVQERLKDCDLMVGNVDNETARFVLNKLSIEALLPLIDMGTEIGAVHDEVQSIDVRVTYVFPGGPCLECRGLIDRERMRLEGLQPEERRRHVKMGYCKDIDIKQPAVMDVNMRAASLASLLIRHLLQPFLDGSLSGDLRESVLTLSHRQLRDPDRGCGKCGYKGRV